jgi:putative ABC transport system permease protein
LPEVIDGDPQVAEIVGIVGDVIYWPPDEAPGPDVYQPALQFSHPYATVMVRVASERWQSATLSGDSGQPMFDSLRRAVTQIDPDLPIFDPVALTDLARAGRADRRFVSTLLAVCALLALGLAAVGIYSITASAFQRRRKDMGLRIALGARPGQLVVAAMTSAVTHAAVGVLAGMVLAVAAGRTLRAILFEVGPNDPASLAMSAAVMLVVAVIAAWLPARRALRIDPVEQLRAD